jgi:hypothetical protein
LVEGAGRVKDAADAVKAGAEACGELTDKGVSMLGQAVSSCKRY